jgi:hypothetical protein
MGSEATNNHGQELLSIMQTVTVDGEWTDGGGYRLEEE